jgi:hypothetical protein
MSAQTFSEGKLTTHIVVSIPGFSKDIGYRSPSTAGSVFTFLQGSAIASASWPANGAGLGLAIQLRAAGA